MTNLTQFFDVDEHTGEIYNVHAQQIDPSIEADQERLFGFCEILNGTPDENGDMVGGLEGRRRVWGAKFMTEGYHRQVMTAMETIGRQRPLVVSDIKHIYRIARSWEHWTYDNENAADD